LAEHLQGMKMYEPGTNYDMPRGVVLLGDKGYGNIPPLLTPFRAAQIRRLPRNQQIMARRFNRRLSRCRIIVEHTFKHVKTYRSIGSMASASSGRALHFPSSATRCTI